MQGRRLNKRFDNGKKYIDLSKCSYLSECVMSYSIEKWSFVKVALILIAAFLIFGGPTYLMLVLQRLEISYSYIVILGLTSFTAGLILFTRLIREEKK